MARPPVVGRQPNDHVAHVYLSPELIGQVDEAAGQEHISRSAWMRRAVVRALQDEARYAVAVSS
jgi:hypothetical protein